MCLTGEIMAETIRKILNEKGIENPQAFLHHQTKLERSYIHTLYWGKIKYPRLTTLLKISKALDMKLSEFLAECENNDGCEK